MAVMCREVVQVYEAARGAVQALRGVDLAARPGTITAVAGPSGSGKSSLLRLLAAIDLPTAGEISIGGRATSGMSAGRRRELRKRKVGFVHQRPSDNLLVDLAVGDQLRRAARHRGASDEEVGALVATLGIEDRLSHLPEQLSGGEQQRVAMARAALGGPAIIVADEPTSELDVTNTRAVCGLLGRVAQERGIAVIVATHDTEVMAAADHLLYLRDGAVQSETVAGRELTVIDATGRLQLPPQVLDWYPDNRVVLEFDAETNTIVVRPS